MVRGGLRAVAGACALLLAAGCGGGGGSSSSESGGGPGDLADGAIAYVALGDSLTAGDGDETGMGGYVGRVAERIDAADTTNLGQSGWDSTNMVEGQLAPAVDAVEAAVADGRVALATVLIGSNDLWYVYENDLDEDAAVDTFRTNVDRTVAELQDAGAVVILGVPDDQSVRPGVVDIEKVQEYLPNFTEDEVEPMSALAKRLAEVVEEIAADRDVRTVDTNSPAWADTDYISDDGIHPNAAGYDTLADLWLEVIEPLL